MHMTGFNLALRYEQPTALTGYRLQIPSNATKNFEEISKEAVSRISINQSQPNKIYMKILISSEPEPDIYKSFQNT